jgi:hypothetical protein
LHRERVFAIVSSVTASTSIRLKSTRASKTGTDRPAQARPSSITAWLALEIGKDNVQLVLNQQIVEKQARIKLDPFKSG